MNIILLGPPGSGKGTQAEKISEFIGIPTISTGDILRESIAKGTQLGREASVNMNKGELVPDDVVISIVRDWLKEPDCSKGFILDGFPRSLKQAEELDNMFDEQDMNIDLVLNIEVDDQEIIGRLSRRRVCDKCQAVYHLDYKPTKSSDKCDMCSGKLIQRDDDTGETVRHRLEVYEQESKPLIEYYRKKGLLRNIRGDKPINEVLSTVKRMIEARN